MAAVIVSSNDLFFLSQPESSPLHSASSEALLSCHVLIEMRNDPMHGNIYPQELLERDDLGRDYQGIGSRLTTLLRQRNSDVQRNAAQEHGREAGNMLSLPDSCIEDPNYSCQQENPKLDNVNATLFESVISAAAGRLGKVREGPWGFL